MALIKCPECGKEVSDKSKQCIHCGYPIQSDETNEISCNTTKVICNILGKDYDLTFLNKLLQEGKYHQILSDSDKIKDEYFAKDNEKVFTYLWNYIDEYDKIPTEITQQSIDSMKPIKLFDLISRWRQWEKNPKFKIAYKTGQVICPKCASSSITTGQKGFSIITGFIGSSQTMNRCANCGYKWKPKG